MRTPARSFLIALVVAATILVMFTENTFASTTLQNQSHYASATTKVYCVHLRVYLNGKAPANTKCMDAQVSQLTKRGGTHPNIGTVVCNGADVTLWRDLSFNGPSICFSGNGFANLTNYSLNFFSSWNDQASSFALFNCTLDGTFRQSDVNYPGYFAVDINGGGQKQYFQWNISKSWSDFNGRNGILPDNSLSSIYIDC
jgi:hypothetical protein